MSHSCALLLCPLQSLWEPSTAAGLLSSPHPPSSSLVLHPGPVVPPILPLSVSPLPAAASPSPPTTSSPAAAERLARQGKSHLIVTVVVENPKVGNSPPPLNTLPFPFPWCHFIRILPSL